MPDAENIITYFYQTSWAIMKRLCTPHLSSKSEGIYGGFLTTFEYLRWVEVFAHGLSSVATRTLLILSARSKISENVSLTTDYIARSKQVF